MKCSSFGENSVLIHQPLGGDPRASFGDPPCSYRDREDSEGTDFHYFTT